MNLPAFKPRGMIFALCVDKVRDLCTPENVRRRCAECLWMVEIETTGGNVVVWATVRERSQFIG